MTGGRRKAGRGQRSAEANGSRSPPGPNLQCSHLRQQGRAAGRWVAAPGQSFGQRGGQTRALPASTWAPQRGAAHPRPRRPATPAGSRGRPAGRRPRRAPQRTRRAAACGAQRGAATEWQWAGGVDRSTARRAAPCGAESIGGGEKGDMARWPGPQRGPRVPSTQRCAGRARRAGRARGRGARSAPQAHDQLLRHLRGDRHRLLQHARSLGLAPLQPEGWAAAMRHRRSCRLQQHVPQTSTPLLRCSMQPGWHLRTRGCSPTLPPPHPSQHPRASLSSRCARALASSRRARRAALVASLAGRRRPSNTSTGVQPAVCTARTIFRQKATQGASAPRASQGRAPAARSAATPTAPLRQGKERGGWAGRWRVAGWAAVDLRWRQAASG